MESNKKSFTGVVTSDKMDKTIVVTVHNRTLHPLYKKYVTSSKKLKASFKICDSIEERASKIHEQLEALYNEQPERKENSDELFRRRGGTSRKDVPKRR